MAFYDDSDQGDYGGPTIPGAYNPSLALSNSNYLQSIFGIDTNAPDFNGGRAVYDVAQKQADLNEDPWYDKGISWLASNGAGIVLGGGLGQAALAGSAAAGAGGAGATDLGIAGSGAFDYGTGLGAGVTGATGGGAGAYAPGATSIFGGTAGAGAGGIEGGASGFVPGNADKAALYSNAGYGSTTPDFSLGNLGNSALKGAVTNGGLTAARGGNMNDILKSAGYGAVGGAVGYGVGSANPGSYLTDNTGYQSIINRGVSGGVNAGLSGGNVGQGALMGAGLQAGNVGGAAAWNGLTSNGGGSMPDNSMGFGPENGYDFGGGFQSPTYGEQSAPTNMFGGSVLGEGGGSGFDMGGGFGGGSSPSMPQQQSSSGNPLQNFMKILASGNGGGGSSPQFGDMAGSLMGMYSAYKNKQRIGGLANNLSGLYGQNSPYAQTLRQQLMRQDAASGRRSQYGPREVELQARLAGLNAQMAPTLSNLYTQQNNATQQGLWSGARLGQQSGAFPAMGNYVQNNAMPWINSMFNQTPANSGPQLGD